MSLPTYAAIGIAAWYVLGRRFPAIRKLVAVTGIIWMLTHDLRFVAASLAVFGFDAYSDLNPTRTKVTHRIPRRSRVAHTGRDPVRNAPAWMRQYVIDRDGHSCCHCGTGGPDADFHIDHIIPWSRGGRTHPSNLQTLCPDCNLRKGARSEAEARRRYTLRSGFRPVRNHH